MTDTTPQSVPAIPAGLSEVELYTRAEAAAALKIKESWLRDNQKLLNLPHTNMGRAVRYSRDDIITIGQIGRNRPVSPPQAPDSVDPDDMVLTPLPKVRRSGR